MDVFWVVFLQKNHDAMIRNANWDHRYATGVSARFCPEADVARSCEEFLGKVTLTFGAPWSNTSTGHKIEDANLPKLEKPIVKHKQFLFSRFTNSFFFADMILTWPTSMVGEWDGSGSLADEQQEWFMRATDANKAVPCIDGQAPCMHQISMW